MSMMKVVPPVEITPERMISSNVPDEYPSWIAGTYSQGDRRIYGLHAYEVLAPSTADNPEAGALKASPTWLDLGPINRWRMFRKLLGTTWVLGSYTENPESIDLTLRPGRRVNSIGVLGVRGASVRVVMTVDGEIVYEKTVATSLKAGGSWYQYFFGPFVTRDNVAHFDLPAFSNADIRVVVSSPGGMARVGALIVGMSKMIGVAKYDASLGLENFSNVRNDRFGNTSIVPSGKRRFFDFDIQLREDQISSVMRTLEPLIDTMALYVGAEEIDPTIIAGRFDRLAIVMQAGGISSYTLETRSLV